MMSIAIDSRRYAATYLFALVTSVLGRRSWCWKCGSSSAMIAIGPVRTQRFPLAFLPLSAVTDDVTRPGLLAVMMAQVAIKGFARTVTNKPSALLFLFWMRSTSSGSGCHGISSDGVLFMTDTQSNRAPGDASALPDVEQGRRRVSCLHDWIGSRGGASQPCPSGIANTSLPGQRHFLA